MSLWESYRTLSPRTRLYLGVGLIAWSAIGLWVSPALEEKMGMVPTKREQEELDQKTKLSVSSVEK